MLNIPVSYESGTKTVTVPQDGHVSDLRRCIASLKLFEAPDSILVITIGDTELNDEQKLADIAGLADRGVKVTVDEGEFEEEEEEEENPDDPENFEELIKELVDMGFERKEAIKNLRLSDYKTELAANMCLNENQAEDEDEDEYESDEDGHVMSRKNLGQSRDVYDTFTLKEKSIVHKMSKKYGVEIAEVVQIFNISDKDPEAAAQLLGQISTKKK